MLVVRRTLLAGGLGVVCAVARPARADDAALAPVTATGTRASPTEAERAPAATQTVVEVRDRAAEAPTLSEVLSTVPGVVVRNYGGPGQLATLSLRGASPQEVLVLLDGEPLTGATSATVDLATLPVGLLDRVEVVRGAVGAIYGPGALGGVVNLVTRAPVAGPPLLSGSITSGSFGTGEVAMSGTGSLGPGTALAAVTALGTQGDFRYQVPNTAFTALRANNDVHQLSGLGRYAMALGGGTLELHAQVEGEDRGLAGTAENPSPSDRFKEDLELLSARYTHALGPAVVEVRPFVRREQTQADLSDNIGSVDIDTAAGVEARASATLGSHALAAVLSGAGEVLTGAAPDAHSRPELAVGLNDEWLLAHEKLSILPAVRLDRVDTFTGISPALAAAFRPISGIEVRASAGRTFRAPTLAELYVDQGLVAPNPTLRPEEGSSAEVSASWTRGTFSAQVALDAANYQDLIVYELAFGDRLKPFNVATAGTAGAEVEAHWRPWAQLTLSASYTFERTADLHDIADYYMQDLPYHPRQTGEVRAAWRGDRWRGQVEALAQSTQQTNLSGTDPLAARLLASAGAAVRPLADAPFWLGVEVKNLLDARTEDLYGYPLAGRSLFASLSFDTSPQEHR